MTYFKVVVNRRLDIHQSTALAAPVADRPAPLLGDVCAVAVVVLAAAGGRRRGGGRGGGGLCRAGGAASLAAPVDMCRYKVDMCRDKVDIK